MPDTLIWANRRSAAARNARGPVELVGRSAAVDRTHELLRRAAAAEGGAILVAEAGADIEPVARELHQRSPRAGAPFVAIDCVKEGAQLDALLFGVASDREPVDLEVVARTGRLADAQGGTLFLHEVNELPASVQNRLARVVRDGEASIDGQPTAVNVRLVASATPGIDNDARTRRFRPDLYRRLSMCRIDLPPLRDRPEDVPALAVRLLEDVCDAKKLQPSTFTQAALALLSALTWPGNLAELRTVVERVVSNGASATVQIEDLLPALNLDRAPARFMPTGTLREARSRFERDYIASVLQHHGWRMAEAAHTLGIQRPNLYRKARQLGITLARNAE